MSNIVLKGDVIQDLGEYLPNPYIERIEVESSPAGSSTLISLDIFYSIMFLISDDYNIDDIQEQITDVNFFCCLRDDDGVISKKELLSRIYSPGTVFSAVRELALGSEISSFLNDPAKYQDDLYDEQGRRILKVTSSKQIEFATENSDFSIYFYAFSSLMTKEDFSLMASNHSRYLNTSNITYEKVFSPGLNVLREEEVIYLGTQGEKYGYTPLLALNRNYYKTQTISRETIISKVNSLIKRFENRSAGPLADSINSIKYVLGKEAETENLLVELDKVRRSFPSKTNNNPVGNLYAGYSKLLQNTNSSFPPSDKLTKQKYLTGKVVDLRTNRNGAAIEPSRSSDENYITNPTFSRIIINSANIERINGAFFVNLEKLAKDKAKFFDYTTPDRFYEVATSANLPSLKAALFSYFKAASLKLEISVQLLDGDPVSLLDLTKLYNDKYIEGDTYLIETGTRTEILYEPYYYFDEQQTNIMAYTYSSGGEIIGFDTEDLYFKYDIEFKYTDTSYELFSLLVDKYRYWSKQYEIYMDQAQKTCSYNNIANNFNNFFSKSVKSYWDTEVIEYPWEMMPTMFAIMSYLTTDTFDTFEEASEYARAVAHNISPDTGNLDFVQTRFKTIKDDLGTAILDGLYNIAEGGTEDRGSISKTYSTPQPVGDADTSSSTDTDSAPSEDDGTSTTTWTPAPTPFGLQEITVDNFDTTADTLTVLPS
jgi:hypothetical protein